jgi:ribose transport system ATP-binding protein
MVSSEMEELIGMCDRILVMCKNRIVAEFPRGQYDQEKIMFEAIGGGENE